LTLHTQPLLPPCPLAAPCPRRLPVLYLFSGADFLTARAFFPTAPEYHLVADFPPGHPACFVDPACTAQANETTTAFFRHWATLRFTRQSTNLMRRAFATSGQLPALLVSLQLIGLPVLHATTSGVQPPSEVSRVSAKSLVSGRSQGIGRSLSSARLHGGARAAAADVGGSSSNASLVSSASPLALPSVTLHTSAFRVTYYSMLLRSDPSEHVRLAKQDWPNFRRWERGGPFVDEQLRVLAKAIGAESRPVASMFKAAPHWILRNAWMAKWVLAHSAATLHDETGLRPLYYNRSGGVTSNGWRTLAHGAFKEFENREVKWYPGEKAELKAIFRGPELPFQFGYAQKGSQGVLMAAWRDEVL